VDPIDKEGQTPLHISATYGFDSIVGFLLDHGANSDLENQAGFKPIDLAIDTNVMDVSELNYHRSLKIIWIEWNSKKWRRKAASNCMSTFNETREKPGNATGLSATDLSINPLNNLNSEMDSVNMSRKTIRVTTYSKKLNREQQKE
jgi:hypothetical protein